MNYKHDHDLCINVVVVECRGNYISTVVVSNNCNILLSTFIRHRGRTQIKSMQHTNRK